MHVPIMLLMLLGLFGGNDITKPYIKDEFRVQYGPNNMYAVIRSVKPMTELSRERIIHQEFDYSCGSAALSTLLNYYLGEKLGERQVIQGLLRYGDSEQIAERRAFSLLDMKKFVTVLGYKGVGYKAEISDLEELDKPCILPIKIFGYRHFTVFKGIYKNRVFLADPWKGHNSFTIPEFKEIWYQNVIFVVYPEGAQELTALRIKPEDLKFVDEDATYDILFKQKPMWQYPERRVRDFPGGIQYYKR